MHFNNVHIDKGRRGTHGSSGVVLRYLGERLHGEGPLCDQLVPAGEGGQDREEVVPQVPADVDVEVALYPRHYQSLDGKK